MPTSEFDDSNLEGDIFGSSSAVDGEKNTQVQYISTTNVLAHVREHFNCSTLNGAELEDDGAEGSRYAHWESRIFQVTCS